MVLAFFFNENETVWVKLIQAIHGGTVGLDVVNGDSYEWCLGKTITIYSKDA